MVGAVLVHGNRIIGEGYHHGFGKPHAEPDCIASVALEDRGLVGESTLYVSLEPCDHHGKTPPCTELIIRNRIPRVVIGSVDRNIKVNGKGIAKLKEAGIEVITGVLSEQADELNRRFFINQSQGRPYIILKWARSSDGFIGSANHRVKISNDLTDHLVHKWRSEEDAIMIGANTAMTDNPLLTNRLWTGKNPVRILLDPGLRVPIGFKIFGSEAKTVILNKQKEGEESGVLYCKLEGENMLREALPELLSMGIGSIMVEGGLTLLDSFLMQGVWDEVRVITNRKLDLLSGIKAPAFHSDQIVDRYNFEDDEILIFRNNTRA
jgi:diaminohydroxyphosphoribosylaminopyrimidine deaminase/5-amino-6-(5-phosphoribosylamino)uracil reductase